MTTTAQPASPLAGLDADLLATIDAYRTCEFATVSRSGTPIAWPLVTVRNDDGTFTFTTCIGFPAKAYNIRRDPRVSLLFSDPTASGARSRPQVVVQGTATCPDEVVTSPATVERFWRQLYERQPAGTVYGANPLVRRLFDFYYFRLLITVTPTRVWTVDPAPTDGPIAVPRPPRSAHDPASDVQRQLRRYTSAVVSWIDDIGPRSLRVGVDGVQPDGALRLRLPAGQPLTEGPVSLLCHRHDERMWNMSSFNATGRLHRRRSGWVFVPERYLPGASNDPRGLIAFTRSCRATTDRYLAARGLPRPQVPWEELKALHPGR
jgi:general stress protein 26